MPIAGSLVDDPSWPFPFAMFAALLNLVPEVVRHEFLGDMPLRCLRLLEPPLRASCAPIASFSR